MITDKSYAVPCVYDIKQEYDKAGRPPIRVAVPGSKSITGRALLLATLARGTSTLRGVLFSDDSRHFLKCVQELGFETEVDEEKKTVRVTGLGGAVPRAEASLYVGSAGTAARFLTAYLGVSQGVYHMDASEQMRRRPMAPLMASLREPWLPDPVPGGGGTFSLYPQGAWLRQKAYHRGYKAQQSVPQCPAHILLPVPRGYDHPYPGRTWYVLYPNHHPDDGAVRCPRRSSVLLRRQRK